MAVGAQRMALSALPQPKLSACLTNEPPSTSFDVTPLRPLSRGGRPSPQQGRPSPQQVRPSPGPGLSSGAVRPLQSERPVSPPRLHFPHSHLDLPPSPLPTVATLGPAWQAPAAQQAPSACVVVPVPDTDSRTNFVEALQQRMDRIVSWTLAEHESLKREQEEHRQYMTILKRHLKGEQAIDFEQIHVSELDEIKQRVKPLEATAAASDKTAALEKMVAKQHGDMLEAQKQRIADLEKSLQVVAANLAKQDEHGSLVATAVNTQKQQLENLEKRAQTMAAQLQKLDPLEHLVYPLPAKLEEVQKKLQDLKTDGDGKWQGVTLHFAEVSRFLDNQKQQLSTLELNAAAMTAKIEKANALELLVNPLPGKVDELRKNLQDLKTESDHKWRDFTLLVDGVSKALDCQRQHVTDLEKEAEVTRGKLNKAAELETLVFPLPAKLDRIQETVQALEPKVEDKLKDVTALVGTVQHNFVMLNTKILDFEAQLAQVTPKFAAQDTKLQAVSENIDTLKRNVDALNSNVGALQTKEEAVSQSVHTLKTIVEALQTTEKALSQSVEQLKGQASSQAWSGRG